MFKQRMILVKLLIACAMRGTVCGQQVDFLDISNVEFRERNRPPEVSGGGCGGSSHEPPPRDNLAIGPLFLDQNQYTLGDDIVFEVEVENVGRETLVLPRDPQVADFESTDPDESYQFEVINIGLNIADEYGGGCIPGVSLYGSQNVPGSLLELRAGEWVQIRAKSRLDTGSDDEWHRRLVSIPISTLTVTPRLFRSNHTVSNINGKITESSNCGRVKVIPTGEMSINVSPRQIIPHAP